MTLDASFYADWLEHDGKIVTIGGIKHKIHAKTFSAIFPYRHTAMQLYAEPINKASKSYKETKRKLGDDWTVDIMSLDDERFCSVCEQLGLWQ